MWDMKTPETTENLCARADDLVAYLYGEASEAEQQSFTRHMRACASCRAEVNDFGEVRAGIGAWREQALSPMTSHALETDAKHQVVQTVPKRSALAAISEFFTLSPMWLRGATAFATLLLIALMVITVMRFFESKDTLVVDRTPTATPAVPERKANDNVKQQEQLVENEPQESPLPVAPAEEKQTPRIVRASNRTPKHVRRQANRQPAAPVLSKEERSQLTELLIADKEDEDEVPRLSDLLSETN
jgi:hypothetical protein